jgi:hypothetical protein
MIKELALFSPKLPKVRLGYPCDGGYVTALQALCRSEALFSYGIATDISFETDYVEATNKKVYLFDHTIDNINPSSYVASNMIFTKEGLSGFKQQSTDNFLSHYNKYFQGDPKDDPSFFSGKVLFKADVEGCEYEFLLNTDMEKMSKATTGMLFEFHNLKDSKTRISFFECLRKINKYFYLCHVHGNNNAGSFFYFEERFCENLNKNYIEKFSIPSDIELSFVNKEIVSSAWRDDRKYPCSFLDRVNNILYPESNLDFLGEI